MDYIWNVTGRCNLNCKYCWDVFKHNEELPAAEAKSLIRHIASIGCNMLLFTGGEPLIRKDFFELVELAGQQGIEHLKLCTNGLLIPGRLDEISTCALSEIHISLDEADSGDGCFRGNSRDVISAVDKLTEKIDRRRTKIVLVSVIHPRNLQKFKSVLRFAADKGIFAGYQFPHIDENRKGVNASMEDLSKEELEGLFAELKQLHYNYKTVLDYFSNFYFLSARKYYIDKVIPQSCGAGKNFTIISPDGRFYPCYACQDKGKRIENCFSSRCLIWFRSQNRALKILKLLERQ